MDIIILLEGINKLARQEKEIKRQRDQKEKGKTVFIHRLHDQVIRSFQKVPRNSKFSMIKGYKVNIQKLIKFKYAMNR